MTRKPLLVAMFATSIAASLAMGIVHAQTAAPKAAAAPAAAGTKALYPQAMFDTMLKQRIQQGQPDTPELRNSVREELNTRELLSREAKKAGLDKNVDVKNQMDLGVANRVGQRVRCRLGQEEPDLRRRSAQGI